MAKIGIDCRIWGVKHGGIGRYTQELVFNLQEIDRKNVYVLFCRKKDLDEIKTADNFKKVLADIRHYSFAEQLRLPKIFSREKLDLLHVPHFNVPVLYKGKFVTTIHDVLWHDIRGLQVTTLPAPAYLFKYFAYRGVVRNTVKRAQKIIVPSNSVRKDLISRFSLQADKVVTTYEGASARVLKKYPKESVLKKYGVKAPYILYVGSLYPHKNVEGVARALKTMASPPQLVVICGRTVFWQRFKNFLEKIKALDLVNLVGFVPDSELGPFYNASEAYIFPSLSEGFGLPGLEAMAYDTPVLASNIPVLKEVYDNAALFFDPKDIKDIADKIKDILVNQKLKDELIKAGTYRVKQFSWRKMAQETLKVYQSVLAV